MSDLWPLTSFAAGAYCIMESIESVCGRNCLIDQLHIFHDFEVLSRSCVPTLAMHLAKVQAQRWQEAINARRAFGLAASSTFPVMQSAEGEEALVRELFVAVPDHASETTMYRGVQSGEWLYRCDSPEALSETWAVSAEKDADAWSRCGGRLWFDLTSGLARSDLSDHTKTVGFWVDLRIDSCGPLLTTEESRRSAIVAETATAAPPDEGSDEQVVFVAGASPLQVACTLLWRLGAFRKASHGTTMRLPSDMGRVVLVGDLVVRAGEVIQLVVPAGLSASLILGPHRIQVERGGQLILQRVRLMDSHGSNAVYSEGVVRAENCSFIRCSSGTSSVTRFTETFGQKGRAVMMAVGGAVFSAYAAAEFSATDSFFISNSVQGAMDANWAGAICVLGSRLLIRGSTFEDNIAEGGNFAAIAGAIFGLVGAMLDISDCVIIRNSARQPENIRALTLADGSVQSLGGAMALNIAYGRIASTLIADNRAGPSLRSAQAGNRATRHTPT